MKMIVESMMECRLAGETEGRSCSAEAFPDSPEYYQIRETVPERLLLSKFWRRTLNKRNL
jgi:hypothetical protein